MRTLFITGGTGFIGRRVLRAFGKAGLRDVRCLTRDPGRFDSELKSFAEWRAVKGDLLDPSSYRSEIPPGSLVVHLAAAVGKKRPREFEAQNVDATRRLLRSAEEAGAAHFVFASSVAATYPAAARSPYADSKRAAEEIVASGRLPFSILRPTMVFGEGSPNLGALTRLATLPVPVLFGPGDVLVQPIDVGDVATIICAASLEEWNGETIEVGGPDTVTLETLLGMIRTAQGGIERRPLHLPLGLAQRVLTLLEPALLPILPFSAGQLAAFAFPSRATPSARIATRIGAFKPLSEMIAT